MKIFLAKTVGGQCLLPDRFCCETVNRWRLGDAIGAKATVTTRAFGALMLIFHPADLH
jgi:hypothetical protein